MKRKIFYFAVSALALSACTSEDVIEDISQTRNVISFENVVNKPSRAEDITTNNLSQFNVFGFYTSPGDEFTAHEIFDDILVKKSGTDWKYTSNDDSLRYWINKAKYYFYAYNCGNADKLSSEYGSFTLDMSNTNKLTAADRVLKIDNYRCDNSHQHDLIYASNTGENFGGILGTDNANNPVALRFKHILTKVNARFTSKFPTEYTAYIKNVSIQNIRNYGDYSGTAWQNVERREGETPYVALASANTENNPQYISVVNDTDAKGNQLYAETGTAFVIPWDYNGKDNDEGEAGEPTEGENKSETTFVSIVFDVDVYIGEELIFTKHLSGKFNPTWLAGYFYTYNIELSGKASNMQAIVFTTVTDEQGSVVDWEKDTTLNIGID